MRRIIRATAALTLTAMPVVGVIAVVQPDGIQGTGKANVSAGSALGHRPVGASAVHSDGIEGTG